MTSQQLIDLDPAMLRDGTTVTRLLLVRHAQQVAIPAGTLPHAWLDTDLSELGLKQAVLVADLLESEPLGALVCSDMQRARRTAAEIASRHSVNLQVEPALAEIDAYAGLPADCWPSEVLGEADWDEAQQRFARERRWEIFGMGETGAQLRARVVPAMEALVHSHPGVTVAVVCHGGVINAYLAHILGIDADMFFLPAHAAASRVTASPDGRRVVETINERHHLENAGLLSY